MTSRSEAGSATNQTEAGPSGWGPPPNPIPFNELQPIDNTPIQPICTGDVSYNYNRKLAPFEWEYGFWPNKKAQLEWRVDQWRAQAETLVHSNYQWFTLIERMHRELTELEQTNNVVRTPITVRQFMIFKWPRADLMQTLRECAEHYPQNVVITRRTDTPARNTILEFIEKQVSAGENDNSAECTRQFVNKYGNI